jgi:hypothetical protein
MITPNSLLVNVRKNNFAGAEPGVEVVHTVYSSDWLPGRIIQADRQTQAGNRLEFCMMRCREIPVYQIWAVAFVWIFAGIVVFVTIFCFISFNQAKSRQLPGARMNIGWDQDYRSFAKKNPRSNLIVAFETWHVNEETMAPWIVCKVLLDSAS